jgi:hypothetical protein
MAQVWQKALSEAQGSILHPTPEVKELFRSATFGKRKSTPGSYQILVEAKWGDECGNGSNSFYCRYKVVIAGGSRESEIMDMSEVPEAILASIPAEYMVLQKWNGCHSFGPWYYIENTLFFAGDKDHNGLRDGERKQTMTNKNEPMWRLVAVNKTTGVAVPLYSISTLESGAFPKVEYDLEWGPCWTEGAGKKRELDVARASAIWPDATDEQLCADNLTDALVARLPALLREFKAMLQSLGFTW